MEYCGRHSMEYAGRTCPRCDAEDRHKELLHATEDSVAETVAAIQQSDYRRANPGDYPCPHCKYISLRSGATRCPLCRGEIGNQYWSDVRAAEKAEGERRRAKAEADAAAERRAAPERAAAARAAASARAATLRIKRFFGCIGGILLGGICGFVLDMFIFLPLLFILGVMGHEGAMGFIMNGIVVIAAIIGGVAGFVTAE